MSLVNRPPARLAGAAGLLAVALAAGLLAGGPAAKATAATRGSAGHATATVPRSFPYGVAAPPAAALSGVSCLSASFCMAVGGLTTPAGRTRALAQEWNGHAWRILDSASVSQFSPSSVSCTSATFCMAVGSNSALRWDGHRWRPLFGSALQQLSGVSCASPAFCMAVGTARNGEGNLSSSWNGRAWHVHNAPSPGDFAQFSGVSCARGLRCTAVGGYFTEVPHCGCALAETWNGSSWTHVTATTFPGQLSAVSCPRAGNCVAVGGSLALAGGGSSWRQLAIAAPGETGTSLNDTSCWQPSRCMAVGDYARSTGAQLTLAEKWNGQTWRVTRTRTPADQFSGLSAVSCPSAASCVAVGSLVNGSDAEASLSEAWNGRRWRLLATPSPGAQVTVLTAVSCTKVALCMAVGYFDAAGGHQAFAEQWNGSSWRVLSIPQAGIPTGVSCPVADSCAAVGSFISGSDRPPFAAGWNGSAWQAEPVTGSTGSNFAQLTAVSCTASTTCIAVGGADTGVATPVRPIAQTWNGTSWQPLPAPGTRPGELSGISCRTQDACMAVGAMLSAHGSSSPAGTLAESWNGTSWTVRATPNSATRRLAHLADVWCTKPSACMAVGGYVLGFGRGFALAESWNGRAWRLLRAVSPGPLFAGLEGVACVRGFRCFAVGGAGAELTLAEEWTGARWLNLPTVNP